jgi:single-stranded-DNA-specific exonuclease
MKNRGLGQSFLNGTLGHLEDYLAIRGLDEAAGIMARHLASGHKILLIGDYDCDGVTSLAQMVHFLKDIGYGNYAAVIPQRVEGYGVPERVIHEHRDAKLLASFDCGTHDKSALDAAREFGMEAIIIDHHETSLEQVAPCSALVNPKHPLCHSAFKEFSSAGLTLLFLTRLRKALPPSFTRPRLGGKYLIMAAIGTVCDLAPLIEGNRILARSGLACMNSKNPFLPVEKLAEKAGIAGKLLVAGHISYYLGPRINAAGRVADAGTALDLLLAENPHEAGRLANELNRLNSRRQQQEEQILRQLRQKLAERPLTGRTLVVGDEAWPHGLVGIIASRIQQEVLYGPAIVLSFNDETGIGRGSARSVPGFDIHAALSQCQDLLIKWGGHKMAAGLTLALENLDCFSRRFEEIAAACSAETFVPRGKVDAAVNLGLVSTELLELLEQLEPHGLGNPMPCFLARRVPVKLKRVFGRDRNHLQLSLGPGLEGVFWRGAQSWQPEGQAGKSCADVVFHIERDPMSGRPSLNIKDVQTTGSSR